MSASAAVFVPISDGELVDRSPLIVEAEVAAVALAPGESFATDYRLTVRQWVKGDLGTDELVMRIPGGVRADGLGLHVWGAPKLRLGDSGLWLLRPGEDGTMALVELMLGAFRFETMGPTAIASRDLSETRALHTPDRPTPRDGLRDPAKFVAWIQDRAGGQRRPPDYFLASTADAAASQSHPGDRFGPEKFATPDKFVTLVTSTEPPPLGCGENGGHSVRWFDFDIGSSVGWRTYFGGQPGLANGGIESFQIAQAAWNDDPNSSIDYDYRGLTVATGGLQTADGINAVLFDDPNDEVPGTFTGGGLLALSGPRFDCNLINYRGEDFHPATEADIVTQDGLAQFFASAPSAERAAEQLFAHELGHTLGLADSTDPDALMFAEYHPDLRGAALDTDDLSGVLYLYGTRDLTPPAAPTNLTADLLVADGVHLAWLDNSDNESVFRIERRQDDGFELVTTVGADTKTYLDTNVSRGVLYTYRVRAQNGAGPSDYTLEVGISTPEDPRPKAPTNLRAAPLSSEAIRLSWQDNSDNESGFALEVMVAGDWVLITTELVADTDKAIVGGLPADSSFSFRVRAFNNFGESSPSNTARTATFATNADCTVSDSELCLLDGRFRVEVDYRNQYEGGIEGEAVAVPSTNESGLFWFFGPENVELIVKLLDGRGFNDHFWVFYGALSDLEYQITVTDTATGNAQIYHNPPGEICGLADTQAFTDGLVGVASQDDLVKSSPAQLDLSSLWVESLDEPSAPAEEPLAGLPLKTGTCIPGPENLCLLDNRLSVSVHWRNPWDDGSEGEGQAIVDTDNSGFFWFFNIENTELVVKALDGGPLNNHLWIFYGALTDLEYWISVTDTVTGTEQVYYNPPGEVCGRADLEAFVLETPVEPPDDPAIDDQS
ncbi:MAG: fibronectin type III domain-containing protein [Acidobacteriota bacterium]